MLLRNIIRNQFSFLLGMIMLIMLASGLRTAKLSLNFYYILLRCLKPEIEGFPAALKGCSLSDISLIICYHISFTLTKSQELLCSNHTCLSGFMANATYPFEARVILYAIATFLLLSCAYRKSRLAMLSIDISSKLPLFCRCWSCIFHERNVNLYMVSSVVLPVLNIEPLQYP